MAYRRNYKSKHHLSISDLDDLIKILEDKQESYQGVVSRVAETVANKMQEEVLGSKYMSKYGGNPYVNTAKEVIPEKDKATAIIRNNDEKALFYEMGTGVVGSNHPAVSDYVRRFGWVYDHHGHGNEGWWYPTTPDDPNPYKWTDETGQLRAWTKGLEAMNGFYNAYKLIEQEIKDITLNELKNS